ncbi:hypothetical protein KSP39_PZI001458 [Platanthera zijinensis]|uniref:WD repeat-containing protein 44 n=1 Tax=Platanthera zijinensis TaxID=2320716 RepID=A0AAP0C5B0_9ASPA
MIFVYYRSSDSRSMASVDEGGDQFYDSREDLSSVFDSCLSSPASRRASFGEETPAKFAAGDPLHHVWIKSPGSILERRARFMKFMGLDPINNLHPDSFVPDGELREGDAIVGDFDRISIDYGAVLREDSSERVDTVPSTSHGRYSGEEFGRRVENSGDGRLLTRNSMKGSKRRGYGWLKRLGSMACIVDRKDDESGLESGIFDSVETTKFRRVRVHSYRKEFKEFSAVYMGQNFRAHKGAILTMKFNPAGEYLASGGEDGVVRVWKVVECARNADDGILDDDPSCIYFNVINQSKLSPLYANRLKRFKKSRSFLKTSDPARVVVPPEIFQISSDKPLFEFHGHKGDVLDLAWSKDKYLLSCSVDKTVRLWELGCADCLQEAKIFIFPCNHEVTCVQFNPIDEKYFLSGSIDGKVRIWEILARRVVNWIDVKQIVTAVCYRPDGKGVVVGSMIGDCCFYDASGTYRNHNGLQLDSKVSFDGKRKSLDKKITGFQFCPSSNDKLMVTSADSVVRILEGMDVVSKYKGLRNTGTRISAAFTSDGKHIVSASEDSNVYIWGHHSRADRTSSNPKTVRSSERFASDDVRVAIPWQGFSSKNTRKSSTAVAENGFLCRFDALRNKILYFSLSSGFALSHEFFFDIFSRGSATWPEENLPPTASKALVSRSLRRKSISHSWGQVIVTAGCDGRIRSFHNYGLPVQL